MPRRWWWIASANKLGNLRLLWTLSSPWILKERNVIAGKCVGFLPKHTSMLLCTPAWKRFAGWRASKLPLKQLCHMLFSPFTSRVIPYWIFFASVSPTELKHGLLKNLGEYSHISCKIPSQSYFLAWRWLLQHCFYYSSKGNFSK